MSSGSHFHNDGGDAKQKTSDQQAEDIKKHVRKHKTKYQMLGAGLVGAYLMRKYGKPTVVEVVKEAEPIEKISLVTSVAHLKALATEPGSFLKWEHAGEPTVILMVDDATP